MANQRRKHQFPRLLPFLFLTALIAGNTNRGQAADIDPSGYQLFAGGRFFLLTDTSFSSSEVAKVRFEADESQYLLEQHGGLDVRVYRVPEPLEFLRKQRNLHRPNLPGSYKGEGLGNVLSYLWDSFYKKSRLVWQRVLSTDARKAAVAENPAFKATPAHTYQTKFDNEPQYAAIKGLTLVDSFRYPVMKAKPLQQNAPARLEGSSSEFDPARPGNVYLPLGKREPGLYLVEGLLGPYRAACLLFVSDQVNVSKLSAGQLLVWAVRKDSGAPAAGARVLVTDGVGPLGSGETGRDGVFLLRKKMPEKVYVMAEDKAGGVFISDNYYYDSEIIDTKVLLHTDRPLYQPGDLVYLKAFGRPDGKEAAAGGAGKLTVLDPAGSLIATKDLSLAPGAGGDASFRLPADSFPGGYSLRFEVGGRAYGGAFRVARYVKPHFEVEILPGKPGFAVKEPVSAELRLRYASGKPVAGAKVEILVKAEKYSFTGDRTVELDSQPKVEDSYTSDSKGLIKLSLPACESACKYVVEARAVDTGAFRVSAAKEILVQGYVQAYQLDTDLASVEAGQEAEFRLVPVGAEAEGRKPARWRAIRLEDRAETTGEISRPEFRVKFPRAGTYTVQALGADGSPLAAAPFAARGPELMPVAGSILLMADKAEYQPGDTAKILLSFPEKVDHALLTLELDEVRKHALAGVGGFVKTRRLNDKQWEAELPVAAAFAPNVVFSVAYVKGGAFVFQNKGLLVKKPDVRVQILPEKYTWAPGERVKAKLVTTVRGKPAPAVLSVSVVDEMVFQLQPELAPEMGDFFFHRRRNQVRTSASTFFHTYDSAISPNFQASAPQPSVSERPLKVMGRARRDDVDTAYWNPALRTNASGEATIEFRAPDSLARWRVTARALAADGEHVGQARGYLETRKDFYLQFLGQRLYREGDAPVATVALFNASGKAAKGELIVEAAGQPKATRSVSLPVGANNETLSLPLANGALKLTLSAGGAVADTLEVPLELAAQGWPVAKSLFVPAKDQPKKLALPAGASKVRLLRTSGARERFLAVADGLAEYPYGCVEQTSTRMIALTEAVEAVRDSASPAAYRALEDRLVNARARLVNMAMPEARFSWWGEQTSGSAFLTAYAYYADWRASAVLGLATPPGQLDHLLRAYAALALEEPWAARVWAIWLAKQMGAPVQNMAQGLVEQLKDMSKNAAGPGESLVFYGSAAGDAAALLVLDTMAKELPEAKVQEAAKAAAAPGAPALLTAAALYREAGKLSAEVYLTRLEALLDQLSAEAPTVDRSLALALHAPRLPKGAPAKVAAATGWKELPGGRVLVPAAVNVGEVPSLGADARVDYTVRELGPAAGADVKITRKLFVLKPGAEQLQFTAEEVSDWSRLDSTLLYADEVTVSSAAGVRYGAVEVPLPPGGLVENTTWGLQVEPFGEAIGNERAQEGTLSYTIPFPKLQAEEKIVTLVRFGQPGAYQLPPARYFSMYRPAEQALEGGSPALRKISVK